MLCLNCSKNPAQPEEKRWHNQFLGNFGDYHQACVGIKIGDCDGDSNKEIYLLLRSNEILQFKNNGSEWLKTKIYAHSDKIQDFEIGDGDGDGKNEIYFYTDDEIYQCKWNGTSWLIEKIPDITTEDYYFGCLAICIGDADLDGADELYAIWLSYHQLIYQYKFSNSQWTTSFIDSSIASFGSDNLAVGDGDNDSRQELYSIDNYNLYHLKRNGAQWQKSNIMVTNCTSNLAIGDGDNDGKNEIYCGDTDGMKYIYISEFSYHSSYWSYLEYGKVKKEYYNDYYNELSVSDADNDGFYEIYALRSGSLYQFKQHEQAKVMTSLAVDNFAVGDGDNDGKNEIYFSTVADLYKCYWQ